jgi:hypothetical protein
VNAGIELREDRDIFARANPFHFSESIYTLFAQIVIAGQVNHYQPFNLAHWGLLLE